VLDNGTTCSYQISTVWRNVDAVRDYPQLGASERLRRFRQLSDLVGLSKDPML
jgi:hypothetical protein